MNAPAHAALLLAAGASRRLGQPKALVAIDGEALVRRTARRLLSSRPHALLVVTGEPALGARIADALHGLDARCIECADWRDGMGATLRCGLEAAATLPVAGVLVCPCDLPRLWDAHLESLLAAWQADPSRGAACRYGGLVGAPAVLPRAAFAAIDATGDRGARDWLRAQAGLAVVDAPELALDLDLPRDLP